MAVKPEATRVVIMGAAGRDFHNFNQVYRDDPASRVVAFTASQIPDIAGRRYPPSLAGPHYPDGIPIVDEAMLAGLCRDERVDQVVFAYSDVSHAQVMHTASIALAAGADFLLLGTANARHDIQTDDGLEPKAAVGISSGRSNDHFKHIRSKTQFETAIRALEE